MKQYEVFELKFDGQPPEGPEALAEITAVFTCGETEKTVRGFYDGNGVYKVRFLPEECGLYQWRVSGEVSAEGTEMCVPGSGHGPVRVEKTHFTYADKSRYIPFGTTIYALVHQEDALIEETMETLKKSPFNKVRHCVFPKSYEYNQNEPPCFAFTKDENGVWDVNRPDYSFWNRLESIIDRLGSMGIESDLILFHAYDRWGFAEMSKEENETYLRYAVRRLAAFPFIWWSLANEYDICFAKTEEDWARFEEIIKEEDPYGHLLSNHYCMKPYDYSRPNITHCSMQNILFYKAPQWIREYEKPLIYDECCYEGDIHLSWGNISAEEMIHRFWCAYCSGAFATHGETYLSDDDVLWWSKGGKLKGKSPSGIAFLREIMESLPGALEPWTEPVWILYEPELDAEEGAEILKENPFMKLSASLSAEEKDALALKDNAYCGHFEEDVFLKYYGIQRPSRACIILPKEHTYRIEIIDTREQSRMVLAESVSGITWLDLPGKEKMAVLAVREKAAVNPYLPFWETVPDGEPHVFGDRVYVFGSHDRRNGTSFCEEDYVCWSAPVDDRGNWRYEGVIYRKDQDPLNGAPYEKTLPEFEGELGTPGHLHCLYAPDVTQGPDGRYYLYYALDFVNVISVAVCDTPAGKYEFLDFVTREDGSLPQIGRWFDPAILCEESGNYLYYGFCPSVRFPGMEKLEIPGAMMVKLADDMHTILTDPVCVANGCDTAAGTDYEAHPFFEASSIRHYGEWYYFVYSSLQGNELCYGMAKTPEGPFAYKGVIVSNGDIGYRGNELPVNYTGNNHGGLVQIGDGHYIFWHRHTHGTAFSRQGCADRVTILEDGTIPQIEITSCGLNEEPLKASGKWRTYIACHLTEGDRSKMGQVVMSRPGEDMPPLPEDMPYITEEEKEGEEKNLYPYIRNMRTGATAGFKYFHFDGTVHSVSVTVRGTGILELVLDQPEEAALSELSVEHDSWTEKSMEIPSVEGIHVLYFRVKEGTLDFAEFSFGQELPTGSQTE